MARPVGVECGREMDLRTRGGRLTCSRCAYGQDARYLEACASACRIEQKIRRALEGRSDAR